MLTVSSQNIYIYTDNVVLWPDFKLVLSQALGTSGVSFSTIIVMLIRSIAILSILVTAPSCSITEKKTVERKPASIFELSNHLNKNIKAKAVKLRPIQFLQQLDKKPQFMKGAPHKKITWSNGLIAQIDTDTNDDQRYDAVSKFKGSQRVSFKTDRNYDGKFDKEQLCKGPTCISKFDDNFDGKIEKTHRVTKLVRNRVLQEIKYLDTGKTYRFTNPTSNHSNHTEGDVNICTDCNSNPGAGSRPNNSAQTKNNFENGMVEPKPAPGYKYDYIKFKYPVWVSNTCEKASDRKTVGIANEVSKALDKFQQCLSDWEKIPAAKHSMTDLKDKYYQLVTNPDQPVKFHCSNEGSSGFGAYLGPDHSDSSIKSVLSDFGMSRKIEKDHKKSIFLGMKGLSMKTSIDEEFTHELQNTIIHEVLHGISTGHGHGTDRATACSALCTKPSVEFTFIDPDPYWEEIKGSFERVCFAEEEVSIYGTTNLSKKKFGYFFDILTVSENMKIKGAIKYEIIEQIKRNLELTDGKGGAFAVMNLEERKRVAISMIHIIGDYSETKNPQAILEKYENGDRDFYSAPLLDFILDAETPVKEKLARQIKDDGTNTDIVNYLDFLKRGLEL